MSKKLIKILAIASTGIGLLSSISLVSTSCKNSSSPIEDDVIVSDPSWFTWKDTTYGSKEWTYMYDFNDSGLAAINKLKGTSSKMKISVPNVNKEYCLCQLTNIPSWIDTVIFPKQIVSCDAYIGETSDKFLPDTITKIVFNQDHLYIHDPGSVNNRGFNNLINLNEVFFNNPSFKFDSESVSWTPSWSNWGSAASVTKPTIWFNESFNLNDAQAIWNAMHYKGQAYSCIPDKWTNNFNLK